jgi:hypothetical protein
VEENVREKYLSIQIVFSNFAGCMEKTNILITAEMKKRRKEILHYGQSPFQDNNSRQ